MTATIIPGPATVDSALIGGKAAVLAVLVAEGFDVPPFFTITADAFSENGLNAASLKELEAQLQKLGPGPFAVRSSGRDEDGTEHSHAGQFLSLLEIEAGAVAAAALKVWQSGATESLRAYRKSRGLDEGGQRPAVLVQSMVRARAAGVGFSADPVSGRRDRLVISAVAGLGDRLAGGEENGENYLIDRESLQILDGPECGVLSARDVEQIARMMAGVEDARGRPQDIEWAFEGERLFLLQARPVTTPLRDAPAPDMALTIFDNSNIVESYPGIVSPLTYSFAQYVYARVYPVSLALLGVDRHRIRDHRATFENLLGRIDGRVYYNLVNWYRLIALLPGFSMNRAHMETMMGVREPLPARIADGLVPRSAGGWVTFREYLRMGRAGFGLLLKALRLRRSIRDFHGRLDRVLSTDAMQVANMPLTALATEYRRVEAGLLDRWDAPLVNDFLCMVAFGTSRKLMKKWAGQEGLEVHNEVMIGQGDIISAEPARRIARMGRMAAGNEAVITALERGEASFVNDELQHELDGYTAKFGDRCTQELKLESITLDEDPRPLLAAVAAAARMERPEPSAVERTDPLNRLFPKNPLRRFIARHMLAIAKARVRDRENLRFERTRVFGHARRIFLGMGRQFHSHGALDTPRDIFYLTVPEVLGAIEGYGLGSDLAALAKQRKAEMAASETRPDPPERLEVKGAAINFSPLLLYTNIPGSGAAPRSSRGETQVPGDHGSLRHGTGCSAGVVHAPARVIHDPRRESLRPGEILVARFTDPGWIAVFTNASAIVVERGSLLSHSAIVARELGIPCVVGLDRATEWIATGETIEVDGKAGSVRKCDA